MDVGQISVSPVTRFGRGARARPVRFDGSECDIVFFKLKSLSVASVTRRNTWCEVQEISFQLSLWEVCPRPMLVSVRKGREEEMLNCQI